MTPLMTVRNLHVTIYNKSEKFSIVRGVNFQLNSGEIVGLVGESGCGKSVTAHAIMRLLTKEMKIQTGEILFLGHPLLHISQKEMENIRGKHMTMIFQDPVAALNPTMKIGQQIIEVLVKHKQICYAEAYQKTLQILHKVGISDPEKRMQQYPYELSGGMCQRMMIAIAIVCEPNLVIADEPTTALDVTIQAQILELLLTIKSQQTSILLITHDLGVVAHVCDRVLVMYNGKIVESATVEQLFKQPQHPYTQALLQSKKSLALPNKNLFSIPGFHPNLKDNVQACSFMPRCPYAMKICQQIEPDLENQSETTQVACWLSKKGK